ncbi:GDSL esterase/lipase WDL1-like [Cicer arietinum]|uniref:GDSL esterase/lipase CPRD49-like n=1 Tax=Cicer arietinum TaxID=3827 RepID=A0A1S2XQM0_CICAR|nr:GDSL esterase/lipase CPRD49-like [Cicer arietinum]
MEQRTTRPQFVLFGSSMVQHSYYEGWGATLCHLYARKADIVLRGYSAWNSTRALQIVDKILPKNTISMQSQPTLVIVYFGGNDSTRLRQSGKGPHVPLEEYKENMRKIAIHIKSLSENIRILFLSTPPVNEEQIEHNSDEFGQPLRTNEACRIYSEACLEMCREENIKAIDMWSLIQTRDDWKDVCFIDGVHLSIEGSKMVSDEILKVLKEAEWQPSLYWRKMPVEFGEDSPYDPVLPDGVTTINVSNIPFPLHVEWDKADVSNE